MTAWRITAGSTRLHVARAWDCFAWRGLIYRVREGLVEVRSRGAKAVWRPSIRLRLTASVGRRPA